MSCLSHIEKKMGVPVQEGRSGVGTLAPSSKNIMMQRRYQMVKAQLCMKIIKSACFYIRR
ncbi:MAG: hypothetical protein EB120_07430 [Proteobacteria bacterium]|nr:hypothetical protein [Pseudomonadota bacterium]NDC24556.1 hypothetical protein [Pseudomonadota bacterium]NDG26988.1 hypothetical protein [Pseudomonadota bacterium]